MIWYDSTITLPVDTVSVIISQSNNTAITAKSTMFGDLATLSSTELSQASSLFSIVEEYPQVYNVISFTLANGTDGAVGSTSFAWPTPYAEISKFFLYSTKSAYVNTLEPTISSCPFDLTSLWDGIEDDNDLPTTQITLDQTFHVASTLSGSSYAPDM